MNAETIERLSKELQEPEGFNSYKEVHQWLTSCCEVKVAYRTVHQWARYRLKGKLKGEHNSYVISIYTGDYLSCCMGIDTNHSI